MATVSVKQVFGVFREWDQGDSHLHTNDPKCGLFSTIAWRVRIIFFNPFITHYRYSKHAQVNIRISRVSKICKNGRNIRLR